jgi:hypothetical protein
MNIKKSILIIAVFAVVGLLNANADFEIEYFAGQGFYNHDGVNPILSAINL